MIYFSEIGGALAPVWRVSERREGHEDRVVGYIHEIEEDRRYDVTYLAIDRQCMAGRGEGGKRKVRMTGTLDEAEKRFFKRHEVSWR